MPDPRGAALSGETAELASVCWAMPNLRIYWISHAFARDKTKKHAIVSGRSQHLAGGVVTGLDVQLATFKVSSFVNITNKNEMKINLTENHPHGAKGLARILKKATIKKSGIRASGKPYLRDAQSRWFPCSGGEAGRGSGRSPCAHFKIRDSKISHC